MLSFLPNKSYRSSPQAARRARRLCVLVAVLCGAPALAAPGDAVRLTGALGYGYDDNLLRIADGAPAFDKQRGDRWTQLDAGCLFEHAYSRQRISAQARWSKVTFDHFRQLDYDGKNLLANWNWQLGNHLDGTLGASYDQALAPYTDFHSDLRNLRQQRRSWFDAGWRLHPSYRLRVAAARETARYALAEQRGNDRTEDSVETGADYLPASGSEFGLVVRAIRGRYPHRQILGLGGPLVDDGDDQHELKARVRWLAGGSTTVQALAGWARRRQPALGAPVSGVNGRVSVAWQRSAALALNAALWRDFAPLDSTVVATTLNRGASVGAAWQPGAKVKVDASAQYERRTYQARYLAIGGLDDALRSASLRAQWAPRPSVQLSATLTRQARAGAPLLGTGNFTSNSLLFSASAQF
ncbi:MAG: exopolysaccharide biosynthesis protein EpsL [Pseudomonadota bacterium]|nr:exopolysaccharide biosynthesis protein EpsL [Pseudomonadota bacterium]